MRKCILWVGCLLVALGILPSEQTQAGPLFRKTPYPPQTAYSPLHYWLPGLYTLKYHHRPFYYEQYTPIDHPPIIAEPTSDTEKEVLPPPKTEPKKEVLPLPIPEPKKEVLPLPIPEPKQTVPPPQPPNNGLQPISATTVPAQPVRFPFLGKWVQRPDY